MKRLVILIPFLFFLPFIALAQSNSGVSEDPAASEKKLHLTYAEYVKLVVAKNEAIGAQRHEFLISKENIMREMSVFEPEFVNSIQRGQEKIKYSQDEKSQLIFSNEADKLTNSISALIQGKVPSGADIKLGYTQSGVKDWALDEDMEYKSYLGVEITQPLMKNAGVAPMANIRAAKKDSNISLQSYRLKMMEIVFNALTACWDYYAATERLKIRRESVTIAEKLLEMNKQRVRLGKMARSELMEAEAGLAKRKSWELGALQDLVSAQNAMKSYISLSGDDVEIDLDLENILNTDSQPDFGQSMTAALGLRPEYLSALQKIDKEKLLVTYARNQRWPQLDLNGSYGLNGLGDNTEDALDDAFDSDHRSWKVGLTLTIPLGGALKTKSELKAAKHRKRQALLELKSVEIQVANIINTAVRSVYATQEQAAYFKRAREIEESLLGIEEERFKRGKSTSRFLLEKEDDLHSAKEAELESIVNSRKASLSLVLAEGSLLTNNDIDVMDQNSEKP
jgi:outer membrane protein